MRVSLPEALRQRTLITARKHRRNFGKLACGCVDQARFLVNEAAPGKHMHATHGRGHSLHGGCPPTHVTADSRHAL